MEGNENVPSIKRRYRSPDVFKGIAMIAIVFVHLSVLVGTTGSGHGEVLKSKPVLEVLYTGLIVFFVISGYFYRPDKPFWQNVKKRVIQIGGTLIVCCVLLGLIMYGYMCACGYSMEPFSIRELLDGIIDMDFGNPIIDPDPKPSSIELWFIANGYYFLRVLLIAFIIFYAIVDWTLKDKRNMAIAIVLLLTATALMLWNNQLLPFNFQIVPISVAFMLVGAQLARFDFLDWIENRWREPKYWIIIGISLAIAITFAILTPSYLGFNSSILGRPPGWTTYTFFVLSLSGGLVMYTVASFIAKVPRLSDVLATIGKYSLGIFALHTFFIKLLTGWTGNYTTDSIFYKMPLWATIVVGILAILLSMLTMKLCLMTIGKIREKNGNA